MTIGVFITIIALLIGPAIRWGTHPPMVYDQEKDT